MSALSSNSAGRVRNWHVASILSKKTNQDFFDLTYNSDWQIVNMVKASIDVVGYYSC
jgi:hypothetical protein